MVEGKADLAQVVLAQGSVASVTNPLYRGQ
jgi:hypothetical protein